ncbi:uncharacterized protein T551_00951 [Pneumocystis jirovecii RU7]|uniref:Nuclear mRNA export factor n=1 Tax=Pneumocystis jirovecii (strain RU7) TaxID=1408657 RepID=A0A0W4ZTJ2_PNEJ7|nr:uncharacterized protein T551_00951 [Pneumocystis jirovecii RU7]KTW31690.1 hypothetical protein T551_00951 [Pneumocystis jirovecii RU7]
MDNKGKGWVESGRGPRMTDLFPRVKSIKSFSNKGRVQNEEVSKQYDVEARQRRFEKTLSKNRYEKLKPEREREREEATRLGLIDDPNKPKRLHQALTFIGTCKDMCPLFEREEREYQKNLERWEINPLTGRVDKNLAVKAFHRPAAGNEQVLPSDVRPPHVLKSTLDYLIDRIVCGGDSLSETHSFVRDRTRSIRQDFTFQNSRGLEAVECHERIARYHILCLHQLCEIKTFSQQQENEQLQKVLQSLVEFYDDLRCLNIHCPHESEFRAYHILSRIQDPDIIRLAQTLPQELFFSSPIQHSLKLYALVQRNNEKIGIHKIPNTEAAQNLFTRFFKLIASKKTTYLMACSVEMHFADIRKGALKAMRRSYLANHSPFPIDELAEMLGCDNVEEAAVNCESYGLAVERNAEGTPVSVHIHRSSQWNETLPSIKQRFSRRLVEAKRGSQSFSDVINGVLSEPYPIHFLSPTLKKSTSKETLKLPYSCLNSNVLTFHSSESDISKETNKKHSTFLNNRFLNNNQKININGSSKDQKNEKFINFENKQNLIDLSNNQCKSLTAFQNISSHNVEVNNSSESFDSNNQIKNAVLNEHFCDFSSNIHQNLCEFNNILRKKESKKLSKKQFLNILDTIFLKMMNYQIKSVITSTKAEFKYFNEKRNKIINEFAFEIIESLIKEFIFEVAFECIAENINKKNFLKNIFNIIKNKYKSRILQKKQLEKMKAEKQQKFHQYYTALKKIDIINTKSKNRKKMYRFLNRETDEDIAEALKKTHYHINELWKNENLTDILISRIKNLSKITFNFWQLLIFSTNYETPTSFWLRQKFELKYNSAEFSWKSTSNFDLDIEIVMPISNAFEKKCYKYIGAVIFECSLIDCKDSLLSPKWDFWKHQLHTLVENIPCENMFRFPLLIIYWMDPEIDMQLDTLFDIPLLKKKQILLTNVEFFKITSIEETNLKNVFERLLSYVLPDLSGYSSSDFKGIKRLRHNNDILDETDDIILFAKMPQTIQRKIRRRNAFSINTQEVLKESYLMDQTKSLYSDTSAIELVSVQKLFDNIKAARELLAP